MWIAVVDDQIQEQEALRAMLTDSSAAIRSPRLRSFVFRTENLS